MSYQTIISASELSNELANPNWVILDCRFDLQDTEMGYREYLKGHIPGALYVHLDRDLSSAIIPGKTGRHPLPDITGFSEKLSSWGIDNSVQVVVYDNFNGGLAARAWWLLRWLGHKNVAVLNGGWTAWEIDNNPIETEEISKAPRTFSPVVQPNYIADVDFVELIRLDPDFLLVDSRSSERYWGINETTDQVAGHIPGAITAPYQGNLDDNGYFLKTEELKERFGFILEGIPPENVIFYCGSGVTAAHNILAMVDAGYDMPRLYPGSWSEWINDPERPLSPEK